MGISFGLLDLRLAACNFPASAKWVLTTMCEIRKKNSDDGVVDSQWRACMEMGIMMTIAMVILLVYYTTSMYMISLIDNSITCDIMIPA